MWSRGDGRMEPGMVLVEVVATLVVRVLVGTVALLAAETATRGGGGYDHKGGDVNGGTVDRRGAVDGDGGGDGRGWKWLLGELLLCCGSGGAGRDPCHSSEAWD